MPYEWIVPQISAVAVLVYTPPPVLGHGPSDSTLAPVRAIHLCRILMLSVNSALLYVRRLFPRAADKAWPAVPRIRDLLECLALDGRKRGGGQPRCHKSVLQCPLADHSLALGQKNGRRSRSFPNLLPIVAKAERSLTIGRPVQRFWPKARLAVSRCHPASLVTLDLRIIRFSSSSLSASSIVHIKHLSPSAAWVLSCLSRPRRPHHSLISFGLRISTVKPGSTSILSLLHKHL